MMPSKLPSASERKRLAQDALDAWTETAQAKLIVEVPIDPAKRLDVMRKRMAMAFLAGFEAARSKQSGQ